MVTKSYAKPPSGHLSTAKVALGKIPSASVPSGRVYAQRLHQNPFSPVPGNVSATPGPGGAAGVIPIVSQAPAALTTPKKKAQAFNKGGLVKPGGGGNVPSVMKSKVIS